MENEITITEAKKITGELKASILKLEALNSGVLVNMQELENLNQKMEKYVNIIQKFEPKDENVMMENYALYLEFLSQKLDDLGKNSNLKKIERIVNISDRIASLSALKLSVIVAVVTAGLSFLLKI